MILDCVVTACNLNPLYYDFIPMFIKAWLLLYPKVDIKIILIADTIPNDIIEYEKYLILFPQINNISTAFISQYIRILYPAILNYDNGILITDIDIIPMNRTYFTDFIKNIDNDCFVNYHDLELNDNTMDMWICYNIALNKTWSQIFNITNISDIIERIIQVYDKINYTEGHGKNGWWTDQIDLLKYVYNWHKITNKFISLKDKETKFNRLARYSRLNHHLIKIINKGNFTDYHCARPYTRFKDYNDKILEILSNNTKLTLT